MLVQTIRRVRRSFILIALVLLFSTPLEAAVLNIVAIGASNTSGWGVGTQDAYPARLQALLRKKGIPANVINAGVLGDTTAGMLRRVDSAVPKGTTSSSCNRGPTISALVSRRSSAPPT